jgi:hypothetical protein
MKRAIAIGLVLCIARQAHAQTRVYVVGDVFAEIARMSRTTTIPDDFGLVSNALVDGETAGGGGRVGAFFSPEWSLELGVDLGRTISEVETLTVPRSTLLLIGIPALQYQARTTSRFSATSILIGYHPRPQQRVQPGFRGGVSLMHTRRTSTTASIVTVGLTQVPTIPGLVPVPDVNVMTSELTNIGNGLTATLAAEAAIEMSRHIAVIPEIRAHAGGIGGFVLRPGVAARWMW